MIVRENASFVRWALEVTALVLSMLSERYWGAGSSSMPAQETYSTLRKPNIHVHQLERASMAQAIKVSTNFTSSINIVTLLRGLSVWQASRD